MDRRRIPILGGMDIEALATANNWTVLWEDQALVVNGKPNWFMEGDALASGVGKTSEAPWSWGTGAKGDDVVIWVPQGVDSDSDVSAGQDGLD